MTKHHIIIGSNAVSAFIIVMSIDLVGALLRFLTVGEVPYTSFVVSPQAMFALIIGAAFFTVISLLPRALTERSSASIKKYSQLPKRRFTRI